MTVQGDRPQALALCLLALGTDAALYPHSQDEPDNASGEPRSFTAALPITALPLSAESAESALPPIVSAAAPVHHFEHRRTPSLILRDGFALRDMTYCTLPCLPCPAYPVCTDPPACGLPSA